MPRSAPTVAPGMLRLLYGRANGSMSGWPCPGAGAITGEGKMLCRVSSFAMPGNDTSGTAQQFEVAVSDGVQRRRPACCAITAGQLHC
jgi:hypothetical protein